MEPFLPIGPHQCSADEQDGNIYIVRQDKLGHFI